MQCKQKKINKTVVNSNTLSTLFCSNLKLLIKIKKNKNRERLKKNEQSVFKEFSGLQRNAIAILFRVYFSIRF